MKSAPSIHSLPLWPNHLEPSQATASKHRSPHSIRPRVRVRVRVGWRRQAPQPKPPYILHVPGTWYYIHTWYQRCRYSSSTTICSIFLVYFIVYRLCAFQTRTPECSQATASKHRSPHSIRPRVRVRVRVGWRRQAPQPKPPYILHVPGTWYYIHTWYQRCRYSSSTTICSIFLVYFIVYRLCAFQTRTPGCAYNTTRKTTYTTSVESQANNQLQVYRVIIS